jgi:hypothetical protein
MPNVVFFLQFLVAIFSMAAGGFWLAASTGHSVGYPRVDRSPTMRLRGFWIQLTIAPATRGYVVARCPQSGPRPHWLK